MTGNILILGGDLRFLTVADEFMKDGLKVGIYGIDEKYFEVPYNTYKDVISAVSESSVIIMGLPASKDGLSVTAPLFSGKIYIDDLLKYANKNSLIFGGMISDELLNKFSGCGLSVYDYYLREELIVKNVVPTVEGALSIAINETPFTIHGSKCLVCGFGRIGKLLSHTLKALGAQVTVSARKPKDMAWIDCYGYDKVETSLISEYIKGFDIIFNTVPYNILNKECLLNMNKAGIIIDLASKPGGLDLNYANALGIKAIWALSLPGKTAPLTAGKIIKNTINNILTELGG